jgi:hypothetical protein
LTQITADISDTPATLAACAVEDPDRIAAQNASRTAAEYRIPVCPPPAFQPAARAHLYPVVADTPATVAAAAGDNPDLRAARTSSRADSGTSLLPSVRNPIEQHPSTNQVLQRPIEPARGSTALVQKSAWRRHPSDRR